MAADDELDAVDVDHVLGDLVERSVVAIDAGPFGPRFRLLETMRRFAAEHLAVRGEQPTAAAYRSSVNR